MKRFIEMKNLQEYLLSVRKKKEYDANNAKVAKTLRRRKEKYVQQKLEIYDQQVKGIEEKSKWGGHHYNCY